MQRDEPSDDVPARRAPGSNLQLRQDPGAQARFAMSAPVKACESTESTSHDS